MDKVNLDINTYTLTELHNLLKLTKPYNQEDILNKKKNQKIKFLKVILIKIKKKNYTFFQIILKIN